MGRVLIERLSHALKSFRPWPRSGLRTSRPWDRTGSGPYVTGERLQELLHSVPDLRSAFQGCQASFDDLFWAHYGRWPVHSKHLTYTEAERGALTELYPQVRDLFEAAHGCIEEEYWCVSLPAGVVRTLPARKKGATAACHSTVATAECHSIVDWKQGDADLVAPLLELDEIAIGASCLPADTPSQDQATHLIFDAYSSVLDALESRHTEGATNQSKELALIERQVELARTFFRKAAQRWARAESLRGLVFGIYAVLAVAADFATFFLLVGTDPSRLGPRLLGWAVAGAVGACLSVLVHVAQNDYSPTYEATRQELWRDGASRPVVGAILGAAIPVFVIAGLAGLSSDLKDATDLKTQLVYIGLSFGAGFSERWARDLISKQASILGSEKSSDEKNGTRREIADV